MELVKYNRHKLVRKPKGKRPLGRPRQRQKIIIESITGKQGGKVWTGYIWLRIGTSGRILQTW
jgi:hypothetical protein